MAATSWFGGIAPPGWATTLLVWAGLLAGVVWAITALFPAEHHDDGHARPSAAPRGGQLRSAPAQAHDLHHDPDVADLVATPNESRDARRERTQP